MFDYIERFYNPKRRHSDRISEPHGVREAGWTSLSRCHPNRGQATPAGLAFRNLPVSSDWPGKPPANRSFVTAITSSGERLRHSGRLSWEVSHESNCGVDSRGRFYCRERHHLWGSGQAARDYAGRRAVHRSRLLAYDFARQAQTVASRDLISGLVKFDPVARGSQRPVGQHQMGAFAKFERAKGSAAGNSQKGRISCG